MHIFLDIDSGKPFNGDYNDGNGYTFWFDNGQSTNINYVKTLYVYSDSPTLYVTMEANKDSVFWIMNVQNNSFNISKNSKCNIYGQEYIKLSHLINISNGISHTVTHGYSVNDLNGGKGYVHSIYILARALDAGEFIETFKIQEDNEPAKVYAIGADFYIENEILKSNLENLEIRLPESIQKAIYEINVHEESFDNIMLNRKYKELLMNYLDIVAKKGSYESLVDSLNWFEYGKLVAIKEYWKSNNVFGEKYINQDLKEWLPGEVMDQISKMTKTTYIGLYLALQEIHEGVYEDTHGRQPNLTTNYVNKSVPKKIKPLSNGLVAASFRPRVVQSSNTTSASWNVPNNTSTNRVNMIYEEINPKLFHIASLWNGIDLSLKMTLLGNFYSTFFAPIHIDLIHSTIENVVYAATLKLINVSSATRTDYVNNIDTYGMNIEYVDGGNTAKMQPHQLYHTYENTIFGDLSKEKNIGGVEPMRKTHKSLDNPILFSGETICGLVKVHCKVDLPNTKINHIYKGVLDWTVNGKHDSMVSYFNILSNNKNNISEFNVYLKLFEPGTYNISMTFYTTGGNSYVRNFELIAEDDTSTDINLYKINKKQLPMDLNDSYEGFDMQELFMQLSDVSQSQYSYQSQFIYAPNSNAEVGVNHTIVIIPEEIHKFNMKLERLKQVKSAKNTLNSIIIDKTTDINGLYTTLCDWFPEYYWKKMNRPILPDMDAKKYDMIIGVCKMFDQQLIKVNWVGNNKPHPKTRYVDEMRFYTAFHTKVKFNEKKIRRGDVVCVIPTLNSSLPIKSYHWEFENISTGHKIKSHLYIPNQKYNGKEYDDRARYYGNFGQLNEVGGNQGMIVADTFNQPLQPGYYDISLHYKVGVEERTLNYKSAFYIEK